jgi:hypothetical protein
MLTRAGGRRGEQVHREFGLCLPVVALQALLRGFGQQQTVQVLVALRRGDSRVAEVAEADLVHLREQRLADRGPERRVTAQLRRELRAPDLESRRGEQDVEAGRARVVGVLVDPDRAGRCARAACTAASTCSVAAVVRPAGALHVAHLHRHAGLPRRSRSASATASSTWSFSLNGCGSRTARRAPTTTFASAPISSSVAA